MPVAQFNQVVDAINLIKRIHRHSNFVSFHRGSNLKLFAAPRANDLDTMLGYTDQLLEDAYFSINGLWQPWLNSALVSHLTACFLDVDVHDALLAEHIETLIARVHELAPEAEIAMPSIIVRSGRGFWPLWLLREPDDPERAVACTQNNRALWQQGQRALAEPLKAYGITPDFAALNLPRVTRVPNSLNSKAGRRVSYTVSTGSNGHPLIYTLRELAEALGVPGRHPNSKSQPQVPAPASAAARDIGRSPDRKKTRGWRVLRDRRRRDFNRLLSIRGGAMNEGSRNHAALLLA